MNNISFINKESRKQIINGKVINDEEAGLYVNNNSGLIFKKDKDDIYYQKIQNLDKLKKLLNPPNRKSLLDTLVELGGVYHKPKKRNNRTFKKNENKKKKKKKRRQQTIRKKKKKKNK
tara:strand:+ start:4003 stop:4356 length:354 start_codon:yes stop_codon:yes gene_type:complete